MTDDSGRTGAQDRTAEVAEYLAAVREALADLPPSEQEDLLDDLSAHLTEVAAEDPTPLRERLGPPDRYAAELRAAADPAVPGRGRRGTAGLAAWWERIQGRLRRLDSRAGPLLGYERASEFGRLLVPAWWVLRGYLAAMVVVAVLDRHGQLGLLPRLGGSTLAGLVILAVFVAGSIWLAHRSAGLNQWQRRSVHVATAFLVLFGLAGFVDVDDNRRSGWQQVTRYVSENPYENVEDVYVVDSEGQLLTEVMLLDQHGDPLDIGWTSCEREPEGAAGTGREEEQYGQPVVTYPRCPQAAPPWLPAPDQPTATPTPAPTPGPTATPTATPATTPTPSVTPAPTPS